MLEEIRSKNIMEAHRLGYPTNEALPLLDAPLRKRPLVDAIGRFAALHTVVAASYGFQKDKAKDWLKTHGYFGFLTANEEKYLRERMTSHSDGFFQWQVEALWAFAWAFSLHSNLDFSDSCSDQFVKLLPDLKNGADSTAFFMKLQLRPLDELVSQADLAYCLHWAFREAELNGTTLPGEIPATVIAERRRALDWILYEIDWDEPSLST